MPAEFIIFIMLNENDNNSKNSNSICNKSMNNIWLMTNHGVSMFVIMFTRETHLHKNSKKKNYKKLKFERLVGEGGFFETFYFGMLWSK